MSCEEKKQINKWLLRYTGTFDHRYTLFYRISIKKRKSSKTDESSYVHFSIYCNRFQSINSFVSSFTRMPNVLTSNINLIFKIMTFDVIHLTHAFHRQNVIIDDRSEIHYYNIAINKKLLPTF